MAYSNKHKIILQAIMHEGALKEDRGKELVNSLFGHNDTAQILTRINAKLQPLYMTIKYVNCEITGELYWVFASTLKDTTVRFQLEYSEVELALLRNIYSAIVTSDDGYVSSTWCLNLCSSLKVKLSKDKAQTFLQDIVEKKWLASKNGRYYMGVRSIGELTQYFKESHEDKLHTCSLCKEILFYGEQCKQCNVITHIHCLSTYTSKSNLKCPNCNHNVTGIDNTDLDISGQKLDISDDGFDPATDDDDDNDDDDEIEISKTKRKVATQKKGKKKH